MKNVRITIIGLGRVGKALIRVLSQKGYSVISAYNRSAIDPGFRDSFPDTIFLEEFTREEELGDFFFLTVSDDATEEMIEKLVHQFHSFNKKIVHVSGSYSSQVFAPLQEIGAKVASFHPMKAITQTTTSFEGIWFDIEGDEEVLKELENLVSDLGANTFRVQPEAKPLLHASAVVASNYLVVLADLVSKISKEAKIPEEITLQALMPLMKNTLENISSLGVTDALTGPIARGDVKTVKQHLNSLNNAPDIRSLYMLLGKEAVKIAEKKEGNSDALQEIKKLLS